MARDKYGRPYEIGDYRKNEHTKKHKESMKAKKEEHEEHDGKPEMREHEKSLDGHHEHHKQHDEHHKYHHEKHEEHHERIRNIEVLLGISHKPDGFKSEDQGGSEHAGAGHVTER